MTDHNCSGCFSHIYYANNSDKISHCSFREYNDKGRCPCTLCIVKCMCQRACHDYLGFRNSTVLEDKGEVKL